MHTIEIHTNRKNELIEKTDKIKEILSREEVNNAVCYLFVPHTTAGITINENADASVLEDLLMGLSSLLDTLPYKHYEGNSPGHLKSSILGCSLNLLVEKGKLVLGTWQGIFFCEFDGPRNRHVYLNFL